MPYCELESGKIYYETHGKGEALLLLRGLGRSSRYWLGYEKLLAKHFKVILVDARGLGQSTGIMPWKDGLETLAQDCLAVLDKLRIKRVYVFGLSLGGMIALSMARQDPSRLRGLIIANSSSADEAGIRFSPYSFWLLLCGLGRGRFHEVLLRRTVAEPVVRSRGHEILASWREIVAAEGIPLVPMCKQLWAARRFTVRGAIDTQLLPVQILVSGSDLLVPRSNSLKLHHLIPGSSYKVIKGAGHEITLGQEREVTALIREFVKQTKPVK